MIDAQTSEDFKKLINKNKALIVEFMENCQKIIDNSDKYGEAATYKAVSLILCLDSLMSIISSPYKDKIEEAKTHLFETHQSMLLENKEHQLNQYINNPNFIFNTPKTLQ
jgi:hypothetical protein